MKIHDVTLSIRPQMPIWPGDPALTLQRVQRMEDGADANVSRLEMSVHTGTHVDAPYHFLRDGGRVDDLPLDVLVGPCRVVEIPASRDVIDAEAVREASLPAGVERVLFKTRNSRYWLESPDVFQTDFVGVDRSGAEELVRLGVRLVGIDYLSIAPFDSPLPAHQVCLHAGIVVVEGLDLSGVVPGSYTLTCLPLKLAGAEGAPARVILVEE
ncbi:MAG TPA: cyclase family protein [Anaerolineaceae bacterium]|nr:cyclase family protein [Anaerolineaceae bacterium]